MCGSGGFFFLSAQGPVLWIFISVNSICLNLLSFALIVKLILFSLLKLHI